MQTITRQQKLQLIVDWQNNKPKNDQEWADDVKAESLHVKYDYQLAKMEQAHLDKIPQAQKNLDKFITWPEVIRYELTEFFSILFEREGNPDLFEGQTLQECIETEFQEQYAIAQWKLNKLLQSVERIKKERELRAKGFVVVDKNDAKELVVVKGVAKDRIRNIKGTTYYVDFDNGDDGADGLTPTGDATNGPWATLDQYVETARSAGDICIVRGGMTQTVSSDLLPTSSGDVDDPIIIKRDYGDEWSDHTDLSGTATATLTFGSKTVTFSADISGSLSAGDWIYVSGDSNTVYAYEVASVVTTTVTLYLPYKGGQAGSGKTVYNMGANPIWNTAAGNYQFSFTQDFSWFFSGLHLRGTDSTGVVKLDRCMPFQVNDCIFEGNGSSDYGLYFNDQSEGYSVFVRKSRFYNMVNAFQRLNPFYGSTMMDVRDCLFDYNSVAGSELMFFGNDFSNFIDCESKNAGDGDINCYSTPWLRTSRTLFRNFLLNSGTPIANAGDGGLWNLLRFEDYNQSEGDNRVYGGDTGANVLFQSETTKVRSGGSDKSIKITPASTINNIWDYGRLKILEIPIYLTATEHTITVYFASHDNTDWDSDPTSSELYLELEAWGHASNPARKLTKSTGSVDFSTDTNFDQSLSVTVTPAQAGVAYLRVMYAKPKEATNDNIFYVDPIPVIS